MKKPTQSTFAVSGFEAYRKPTRRELILAEMEQVVPWKELLSGPGRCSRRDHGA